MTSNYMTEFEKNFIRICEKIKKYVTPHKTNIKKIRIGGTHDGGYVVGDLPEYDALYSYGSNDQTTFERDFYRLFKKDSYVYDHTIDSITDKPEYIHFFKEGVNNYKTSNMDTLDNHIIQNGHTECKNLFGQIDIEGDEFKIFNNSVYLTNFSQILIEFHMFVLDFMNDESKIDAVFSTLLENFVCIHIHGNNSPLRPWMDGNLPMVFECTFIRKDLVSDMGVEPGTFPLKDLDFPNDNSRPDLRLDFWHN
jgi:hypothetical protein